MATVLNRPVSEVQYHVHSWKLLPDAIIYGNYYQMAIIDVKKKYVWDYYLETKDQVLEKIQEWLEKKMKLLCGRDPLGFEVVLFSDMGEAKSTRVEELCSRYGARRETTTGYSPAHKAFVERWFRTNAEMSRCHMLQYDTYETH
jgi:transposase InsO family protein